MKHIQLEAFGQPSQVAKLTRIEDVGAPASWEVVVDIEAFPINVADLAMMAGRYGTLPKPPSPIGMEAVGRISACGTSVKKLQVGDRVVLLANNNWAERRKLPAAAVHRVPADSDVMQMSMLKVNPATAYILLKQYEQLAADEWIVQTAPLSSVGRSVIQIAKSVRLRTINIVRRAESIPEVLSVGGDIVLEDGPEIAQQVRKLIRNEPIRLALDAVAGPGIQRLAECLSEGGKIVNYGMLSNDSCGLSPEQTIFRGITLEGFWLSKTLNRMSLPDRTILFDSLSELVVNGKLKMAIDSCYSMDEIGTALLRAEQNHRTGKVIVLPSGKVA